MTSELDGGLTLRTARDADADEIMRRLLSTFGESATAEELEQEKRVFEPERNLVVTDAGDIVATAGIYSRVLSVPGAQTPVAGVTYVSVAPTHRRRGVLTAMMGRQLADLHERAAEPVAALWASESLIYGRFGYGCASLRAFVSGQTRSMEFRTGTELGTGRIRESSRDKALPHIAAVYEAVLPAAVGHLARSEAWWALRFSDTEHARDGASELRFVLHEEANGEVTGWATYRVKADFVNAGPNAILTVLDVSATTPQAYAKLWRFLLDLDLIRSMRRRMASPDEPLRYLLADPRALTVELVDALWIRLVDVGRGLETRRYSTDVDVVFEVTDEFCPWNSGRWRLTGGPDAATCRPTDDAPDLALSSAELGAAYLGGTSLGSLAAAGRVRELTPGALRRAAAAFTSAVTPFCPEVF